MAEKSTFIKLDRNIQEWRWYNNANTFRVFVHLLLNANVKKNGFEGVDIERGQLATSYPSLAAKLKMSINSIRTAFLHLKSTGEITVKKYPKFSVVTIVCYDKYQDNSQSKSRTIHSQATVNPQSSHTNIRSKEIKNERSSSTPPQLFEISSFCSENGLNVNAEKFYDYYSGNGWKTSQGKPITDWKALLKKWSETEREHQAVVKKRNNNTLSGLPLLGSDDDD